MTNQLDVLNIVSVPDEPASRSVVGLTLVAGLLPASTIQNIANVAIQDTGPASTGMQPWQRTAVPPAQVGALMEWLRGDSLDWEAVERGDAWDD